MNENCMFPWITWNNDTEPGPDPGTGPEPPSEPDPDD
jgi:hypothetical protein